jgi:hypothetical protein
MKAKRTYKWVDGFPARLPASVAGQELARLRAATPGGITPQAVVDSARPDDAPLHPAFEWDDYSAAEAYRRQQAKGIIRAIVTVNSATKEKTREYVGVRGPAPDLTRRESTVYVTTREAVSDAGLFAEAITRLEMHVNRARSSLEELRRAAQDGGIDPERLARIALAATAIEAASAAVSGLH